MGAGSERPGTQAHFRAMKAEGGWGTVCTEYCSIHPESDEYPWTSARLWDEGDVVNLGYMCDLAHQHGSLTGVQLWYSGIHAINMESREIPRGATQFSSNAWASRTVYGTEMDDDDILALINMYIEAAKRAEAAGFDILEVSGGDTTLSVQFLDRRYNMRSDKYGGSFENRARFYIELMTALKKVCGDTSAITARFEVDTLMGADGIQATDEDIRFVELLNKEGICDLWSVKIGDYEEWGEDAGTSRFRKSGWMTPFVKDVKGVVGDTPVVVNGRFTSPDDMAALIKGGVADIIGAARPSIADPFLPAKIDEGRLDDIRECIGCNMCVSKFVQIGVLNYTQNATAMEKYRRGWHPEKFDKTENPCSVLVVGGGPAGMECARVLGERGYNVHLREAEDALGGPFECRQSGHDRRPTRAPADRGRARRLCRSADGLCADLLQRACRLSFGRYRHHRGAGQRGAPALPHPIGGHEYRRHLHHRAERSGVRHQCAGSAQFGHRLPCQRGRHSKRRRRRWQQDRPVYRGNIRAGVCSLKRAQHEVQRHGPLH